MLLQLVYLAAARPGGPLERTIADLCRRSLGAALRASWLLLALHQGQPGNRHLALFREKAELAALGGDWVRGGRVKQLRYQQQQTAPLLIRPPLTQGSGLLLLVAQGALAGGFGRGEAEGG